MVVMAASDEAECRAMLSTAFLYPGPAAVRYPRGAAAASHAVSGSTESLAPLALGKGVVLRETSIPLRAPVADRVAIFAFGAMVGPALVAGDPLDATVVNMRFIKPLDVALLTEIAQSHDLIVTIEEACIMGGAGSACAEALADAGIVKPILHLGLPDQFIDHGDPAVLLADCGLNAEGIVASVRKRLADMNERRDDEPASDVREPRLVVNNA